MVLRSVQRVRQATRRLWGSACSRLTTTSVLFLLLGTLILLACVGFLAFLWFPPDSNSTWHSIVVSGWLIRTVTITTVVIRAVAGSQTILCTSILASLLLDCFEAPITQSAAISIMRYQVEGPWSLLEAAIHKPRTWRGFGILALLVTILMTSLASQFTSTALLTDIQPAPVPVKYEEAAIAYGVTNTNSLLRGLWAYLQNRPAFPTFSEYWEEDPVYNSVENRQYTGKTLRSFLPIEDEDERGILRRYEGLAPVFDTTVTCKPPPFLDVSITLHVDSYLDNLVLLAGRIDQSDEGNMESGPASVASFNCTIPIDNFDSDVVSKTKIYTWEQFNICNLNSTSGGPESELPAPTSGSWDGDYWVDELPPKQTYLVLHSEAPATPENPDDGWFMYPYNLARDDVSSIENNTEGVHGSHFGISDISYEGAWAKLQTNASTYPLAVSLCYSSMVGHMAKVSAWRSSANVSQPHPIFDQRTGRYDTSAVLEQLGITPRSEEHPPTLHLSVNRASLDSPETATPEMTTLAYLTEFTSYKLPNAGDAYSSGWLTSGMSSGSISDVWMDRLYGAVFRDVMASTASPSSAHHAAGGNAAKALQSLLTLWAAQAYYDLLPYFDLVAPATLTREAPFHQPVQAVWLAVVVALLGLHLLVVGATLALFLASPGLVGGVRSAWAAVACVRGPELDALLEPCPRSDRAVCAYLRDAPQYGGLVGVDAGTGRLRFERLDAADGGKATREDSFATLVGDAETAGKATTARRPPPSRVKTLVRTALSMLFEMTRAGGG
ncbi:hypothetical protein F4780DRAFT_788914 [Xylariomycetidae sp. FL0641]|nr:hypothetical protein F4780DRAFT_788914 [Xylariomycetidae sp. FL0641]